MLVPIKWLKEYVDIDITTDELSEKLVSCGFEIEDVIDLSEKIKNVVTGKIIKIDKHPNADKLKICLLDTNGDSFIQVVTGADNVSVNDIVPIALDGAKLPGGKEIKTGELRGVTSYGMLASGGELELTEHDYKGAGVNGILILDKSTPVGVDINEILGTDDIVLDVGVTANRTDANSIYGIAREVAAVTGKPLKPLNLSYTVSNASINNVLAIENKSPDLCPRYMAAAVENIKLQESPTIIKNRLRAMGLRPINNIVDITNYVLFEIGQPMHAFDLRTIENGKIIIRTGENEKITALDDKEYTLTSENLVIANAKEPMAVAGVMGGKNYSVLPDTNTVIFESARFKRDNIRKTARILNLHSDSSARYEKGVDFYSQETGMKRALALMCEYDFGNIMSDVLDSFPVRPSEKTIEFTAYDIERILGLKVPDSEIERILNSLCLKTIRLDDGTFKTEIPGYREDMDGINDIAEEIIRIYGYDNIKATLIKDGTMIPGGKSRTDNFTDKIKNVLIGKGASEIITYSFVSPKIFDLLALPENDVRRTAVRLDNALGEDFSVMRTTLAHSMLKILSNNYIRGNKTVRLFEIAKTYIPKTLPLTERPDENNVLALGAYGTDFYEFKSIVEDLLSVLRIKPLFKRAIEPFMHETRTASVIDSVTGKVIGYLGEVSDIVASNYGITNERAYIAELDEKYLVDTAKSFDSFALVSKFQSVERDLALLCESSIEADVILNEIRLSAGDLLVLSEIFDVYSGGQVPTGYKSVAVKLIFQSMDRTLKDADVNAAIDSVLKKLAEKGIKLR